MNSKVQHSKPEPSADLAVFGIKICPGCSEAPHCFLSTSRVSDAHTRTSLVRFVVAILVFRVQGSVGFRDKDVWNQGI